MEIVGIVRDMREQNERKAPGPSIYVPMNPSSGEFFNARTLVVRTAQEMTALEPAIASRVASVDPRIPTDTERLDATLAVRMQDERFYAVFVGLVALFGLLLAGVGIAGVAAQGVVRRTHEIGVRLALGADVSGVVRLVVRQVSVPVVIGIGVGIGGAVTATGVLTGATVVAKETVAAVTGDGAITIPSGHKSFFITKAGVAAMTLANPTATTVALPVDLLSGIDAAVRSGRAASRNAFLARAVRHELERLQREAIDRQFEMMATDAHYQREARRISDEYVTSDWEALRVAEGEP